MRPTSLLSLALACVTFGFAEARATVIEEVFDPSPESSTFVRRGDEDLTRLAFASGAVTLADARFGTTPSTTANVAMLWLVVGDVNLAPVARALTNAPAPVKPAVRSTWNVPADAPLFAAIVAVVPEPMATGLLASGMLGLFFVGRSRR